MHNAKPAIRCPHLHEAFLGGFPPYLRNERASSPANASPYVMSRAQLDLEFHSDEWRLELINRVDAVFAGLGSVGVEVPAFLIGGGFVRRLKEGSKPSDLDGLAFYTIAPQFVDQAVKAMAAAKLVAKKMSIDLRFCPLDADPFVMIRSIAFYSVLYSKVEAGTEITNGMILYRR